MGAAVRITPARPGGLMVDRVDPASAEATNDAMERYADGDDLAYRHVYEALEPRLRRFALALVGSGAGAEDVIQQTLLQIHLSRTRFVRGASVVPWAFAIARNVIRDARRRLATEQKFAVEAPSAAVPTADEELEQKRRWTVVEEEIRRLPERLREAFLLVNVEELPVSEAAEALGISAANVKVRAWRARKLLAATGRLRLGRL